MVKTLPFNAGHTGLIPGPDALGPEKKKKNINDSVTNSIKTLKMVQIKSFFKKKREMI